MRGSGTGQPALRVGGHRGGEVLVQLCDGGGGPLCWPPKVKFDLTSDEVLTQSPTLRLIGHHYSDQPLPVRGVA
jgi:hypothetical protein